MSRIAAKSRPVKHPGKRGSLRPLCAGIHCVELDAIPDEAAALGGAQPRLTGDSGGDLGTVVTLRNEAGELLSVSTVSAADESPLAGSIEPRSLARTAYLGDFALRKGHEHVAPLAAYAAARRARINGATTIAAHVCDPERTLTGALGLVPMSGAKWLGRAEQDRAVALVPTAQRLDVALDRSYRTWIAGGGASLDAGWFVDEVEETIERWLADIYGRGFFAAVFDRTLTRDQYVYAASNMHQFVRWTTRLLGRAVACAHERGLRDHFLDHLQGEVNHELIIERDLAHLGVDVEYVVKRMAPSPHTRHFMAVQESLIAFHRDPMTFMASPLAAEGIASHLTPAFVEALEQTIEGWGVAEPKRAMAFFTSHIHTDGGDDGHWESTIASVAGHLHSELVAAPFLATLRASMSALTGAYDEYVDDLAVLGVLPLRATVEHHGAAS